MKGVLATRDTPAWPSAGWSRGGPFTRMSVAGTVLNRIRGGGGREPGRAVHQDERRRHSAERDSRRGRADVRRLYLLAAGGVEAGRQLVQRESPLRRRQPPADHGGKLPLLRGRGLGQADVLDG